MRSDFTQYTPDYISGVMSLRKPQDTSLNILHEIMNSVSVHKDMELQSALDIVHAICPTCTDFERDFMSLTFALATGVGKTRLMGAFIAYLYTQHDIKNFFVVAPGTTIYDKLKHDFSDNISEKYVFKGLGCFSTPPRIVTGEDYNERSMSIFDSDVHIFICNIGKFDKESANMKKENELIGGSFYELLSNLPDLVLIMDESHHYRAEKGMQALNELHPVLGLELTATPLISKGSKQIPFKNVVYEYPLSAAIADGYTRTPFAITRSDINFYNFGEEQLDKLMLLDGIACHERVKRKLEQYAMNNSTPENPIPVVKPFMLVVCKDTDHASWVLNYIRSDEFKDGVYENKTLMVHSKQKGIESEANTKLLLSVEKPDNPVEIVIHVNMLKEGWDVNNLYTIVPLRTAASKVLREQMVGRGLRLPYGRRTGDKDLDAVMLTAHDKFSDILEEAKKGDSIFKAGNIIKAEEIEQEQMEYTQTVLNFERNSVLDAAYAHTNLPRTEENDAFFSKANDIIGQEVTDYIQNSQKHSIAPEMTQEHSITSEMTERHGITPEMTRSHSITPEMTRKIADTVSEHISKDKDLGRIFIENQDPFVDWVFCQTESAYREAQSKYIPIPQIKVTDFGVEEYCFVEFDLDLSEFNHTPIKNELLIQNLEDLQDRQRVHGDEIDFEGYRPCSIILEILRQKPEIDYEKCSSLLFSLIMQVCNHYENLYGTKGMQNIVMMYKRDIANKIYKQMMQHFYRENGFLTEEVIGTRNYNLRQSYSWKECANLYEPYSQKIQSVLFTGIHKGVFSTAKFDSAEGELVLAKVLESDDDVINWLRPAPKEFNITYNHGKNYEPDFVVETEDTLYMVEVKAEKAMNDPDVIAKKNRALKYCQVATDWSKANGYKPWNYLFIPAKQVQLNSSFRQLAERFCE